MNSDDDDEKKKTKRNANWVWISSRTNAIDGFIRYFCAVVVVVLFYYHSLFVIRYSFVPVTNILLSWLVKCSICIEEKWENSIKSQAKPEENKDNSQSRKIKHVEMIFLLVSPIHIHIHIYIFAHTIFYLFMALKLKQFHTKLEPNNIRIYNVFL